MKAGLEILTHKCSIDNTLIKTNEFILPKNIELNKIKLKLKPTNKINNKIIFEISNIYEIKNLYFSEKSFEKCTICLDGETIILDYDYNEIINEYNNTPKKLNFWFTMENSFLPKKKNIKIEIILKNASDDDELLIEMLNYSRIYNNLYFMIQEHQVYEFNLSHGINKVKLKLFSIIKELYFICTDENNSKGNFVDTLTLFLNGHRWMEKLDKEFMLTINQIQKNKIIKNLYYLPFFLQKDKFNTIGILNGHMDDITACFTTNRSCKIKIIAVNHNISYLSNHIFIKRYSSN